MSAGVYIFAQDLSEEINPYVFPPFGVIFPVISYLKEQNVRYCTCVVPFLQPVPVWLLLLKSFMESSVLLGQKGEKGEIKVPSRKGVVLDDRGLKWTLIAYRLFFLQLTGIKRFTLFFRNLL